MREPRLIVRDVIGMRSKRRERIVAGQVTALLAVVVLKWSWQRRRCCTSVSALAAEESNELMDLLAAGQVLGEKGQRV